MNRLSAVRRLVFNEPYLQQVREMTSSDAERWRVWLDSTGDMPDSQGSYAYLQKRFDSFDDFCRLVELFQVTAVERHANRRWTSRFLYPYGPDLLYADLDGSSARLGSNDRRFFARGGELLYLMLNRSSRGAELSERLEKVLMDPDTRWNRAVRALIPPVREPGSDRLTGIKIGYLPHRHLPQYEQIAEDWLAVLQLDVPGEALLDPLVRVTGLNLVLYLLERAHAVAGEATKPRLLLEIAGPRRGSVLDLAQQSFEANRDAPALALAAYLGRARRTSEWADVTQQPNAGVAALDFLKHRFCWRPDRGFMPDSSADRVFQVMRTDAEKRHHQHFRNILPTWSRQIGLAMARRGVGTWYAPDDAFLKAIVLVTVGQHEELRIFLEKLYRRYGIVIGPIEAEQAFGSLPTDFQELDANQTRLEMRLRALGLLERLSDDCAYVRNPFRGRRR
ncbi:MAG: hypothetical protein HYV63_16810 [Candidatus Schekmanbacteria bacterium]|nr:hypothetical protein [Candidatus Schekmanbacteria bacterium]